MAEYALIESSKKGDLIELNQLIQKHVKVNHTDKDGCSALMHASCKGFLKIITTLLDNGANRFIKDKYNWNCIMIASVWFRKDVINTILNYPSDIPSFKEILLFNRDVYGRNVFTYACKIGNIDFIIFLLDKNFNINEKDLYGWTALMYAIVRNNFDVVELLFKHNLKININIKNNDGETKLILASIQGYLDIVKLLLLNGSDINSADENGYTALIHSVKKCHIHIINELLSNKFILINKNDNKGCNALIYACINQNVEIVKLLLINGALINKQDYKGLNAFMYVCINGNLDIFKLLIDRSLIDKQDIEGYTALSHACINNKPEIVELLLTNGANIHIKDYEYGDTILLSMMLGKCKNVNVDIINMLLLHGANINDKSKNGETIFDSAVFRIRDIKFMIKKWPVMMGIIIFKHLVMYHELDASTFIDLWEYVDV